MFKKIVNMKKLVSGILLASLIISCNKKNNSQDLVERLEYPETKKDSTVFTYFGEEVADPYHWLANDRSEETGKWVTAQNETTYGYLAQIPYLEKQIKQLESYRNYEKIGTLIVDRN